jgi:menaquinone-dependent protoporphyrinogen oxidase
MAHVLIVYGTTEGQTAKIAQHIADVGRRRGHRVDLAPAAELGEHPPLAHDAAIVGASLHEGHYQRSIDRFCRNHAAWLRGLPSAFFSVSLGAASRDPDEPRAVEALMKSFLERSGWAPLRTASFAGALRYMQYSWLKRALMRSIARHEGGATDTSQDHEYTDWDQVSRFAQGFFDALPEASGPTPGGDAPDR